MKFDIHDTIEKIVSLDEYKLSDHSNRETRERWTIQRRIETENDFIDINIDVIAHYEENVLAFVMPFYDGQSFGLRGKYLYIFDSVLHNVNSRTRGGYLTKYTYDETYAPIYLHHLPLDRMDVDWLKDTLEYFRHAFIAYRPLLDLMINELGLRPEEEGCDYDEGRQFIMENKPQYLGMTSKSKSSVLIARERLQELIKQVTGLFRREGDESQI